MAITLSVEKIKLICNWVRHEPSHVAHLTLEDHNLLFVYASSLGKNGKPTKTGDVYVIDLSQHPIGKGGYGTVCTAYKVNENATTTESAIERPAAFVAKIQMVKKYVTPEIVAQEMALQNNYYPTAYPTDTNTQLPTTFKTADGVSHLISIMPLLPGKDLWHEFKQKAFLKKFDLLQRINMLAEIAMAFNVIHQHTPSTGSALFHSDVKPHNINVNIRKKKVDIIQKPTTEDGEDIGKIVDVYPFDFGFAMKVASDDAGIIPGIQGTPLYVAPEIVAEKREGGIKSDIYALTSVAIKLLGGKDPDKFKNEQYDKDRDITPAFVNMPYDITGLCHEFKNYVKDTSHLKLLEKAIQGFVTRMQRQDYDQRPGPKEFLRFFVTLNNYFKTLAYLKSDDSKALKDKERTEYDNDLDIYVSTLVDLANGELDAISPHQEPRPSQIVEDKTPEIADEEIKDGKQEVPEPNNTKTIKAKSVDDVILDISKPVENNDKTITSTPPQSAKKTKQQPNQPFVTQKEKGKLLQKMLVYKNSDMCGFFQLTRAKAMLAAAFIKTIEESEVTEVTYADIEKYTACLKTLNYALEEIDANETKAKRFFGAIKQTNELELYQIALTNLFKAVNEGASAHYVIKLHTKPLIENSLGTLLSQSASIINRQKNDANAHVGKHYSRLFSSRLGRAANDIESNLQKLTHNKK